MAIVNFGSLNIDHVYRVAHITRPGETLSASDYRIYAGGKGLNQSVALGRAGTKAFHAGSVGPEGAWLVQTLRDSGVDTRHILQGQTPTGHAMIQVDAAGQNAITLFAGANRTITKPHIESALSQFGPGDYLLLQNEVNDVGFMIEFGRAQGMQVAFNAAPFGPEVKDYPLNRVDWLCVNQTEGADLAGVEEPNRILETLAGRFPQCGIVLTLGGDGVMFKRGVDPILRLAVEPVSVVDTTAAGDTFLGYFLAGISEGGGVESSLRLAIRAAGICVGRSGASASIPNRAECGL